MLVFWFLGTFRSILCELCGTKPYQRSLGSLLVGSGGCLKVFANRTTDDFNVRNKTIIPRECYLIKDLVPNYFNFTKLLKLHKTVLTVLFIKRNGFLTSFLLHLRISGQQHIKPENQREEKYNTDRFKFTQKCKCI